MRILNWLSSLWPFVTKNAHLAQLKLILAKHEAEFKEFRRQRAKAEDDIRKEFERKTDRVLQPLAGIRWDEREHGMYAVQLTFDPRTMTGRTGFGGHGFDRDELRWIAASFGRMVENEIASLTFVEKAKESRREEYSGGGWWNRPEVQQTVVQPKGDAL